MRRPHAPRHVHARWHLLVLVSLLAALVVPLTPAAAADDAIAGAPPATIRVCDGDGTLVDVVPFDRYVKTVLPREFPPEWPTALLQAGAIAIRSYAWYHVRHPWRDGCDLSNTTRHQLYCPDCGNPPDARSDAAVDATWHLRLDDASTGDVAFAQYCSGCSGFPEGRHIDEYDAKAKAEAGWSAAELIAHFYRDMPPRLVDWREPFGLTLDGGGPYPFAEDPPLRLTAAVAGVPADDPRGDAHVYATCTMGDQHGTFHLDEAGVIDVDGRPSVVLDDLGRIRDCREDEVLLTVRLTVNGWTAATRQAQAWRPWSSRTPRQVDRLADTDDPVAGAVAISQRLFAEAGGGGTGPAAVGALVAMATGDDRGAATTAVVARDDAFADALSATALAGPDGPILFTPGGPDAPLAGVTGDELERILAPGATVHVVGGPNAVSRAAEDDLRARGFVVQRHAGATRIETAIAVADHLRGAGGDTSTVLVARGYPDTSAGWADAVTAGAFAAIDRHPILLTGSDTLDPRTASWLDAAVADGGTDEVVLLGGTAAVPADAETAVDGAAVRRVAGATRDATAVAVIDELWSRPEAPDIAGAVVIDAYGDADWPFALAAAVYSARLGAPQVVTHRLVPRTTTGAWLDGEPGLPAVVVGGTGVVGARVEEDVAGD